MKITIEHYGDTSSWQGADESTTAEDAVANFLLLLELAGWHRDNIQEAITYLANEKKPS